MMDPKEKLVPIWVREYVEWKIDQSLGDKPPLTSSADSGIPERGDDPNGPYLNDSGAYLLNGVVKVGPRQIEYWRIDYVGDDGPTGMDFLLGAPVLARSREHAELILHALNKQQPAGGPPTPDLADSPDSNPQEYTHRDYEIGLEPPTQPIGVHDYNSLVACLRSNFKLAFGFDEPLTDPQDMIQKFAAEIQNLKRLKGGGVQGLESEVRVPSAESGPEGER